MGVYSTIYPEYENLVTKLSKYQVPSYTALWEAYQVWDYTGTSVPQGFSLWSYERFSDLADKMASSLAMLINAPDDTPEMRNLLVHSILPEFDPSAVFDAVNHDGFYQYDNHVRLEVPLLGGSFRPYYAEAVDLWQKFSTLFSSCYSRTNPFLYKFDVTYLHAYKDRYTISHIDRLVRGAIFGAIILPIYFGDSAIQEGVAPCLDDTDLGELQRRYIIIFSEETQE